MSKIEEILNDHCGAIRFIFHNDEGNMRDEYDIICAMREFGKICFDAARKSERISKYTGGYNPKSTSNDTWVDKYETYEDFLKEIENENI